MAVLDMNDSPDSTTYLATARLVEIALEILAVFRHEEAEAPVDQADEDIGLPIKTPPIRVVERVVGRAEEIEEADDDDQRGVLEGADEGVDERRDHRGHEQDGDQRHAANELDIGDRERMNRRHARAPAEGEQDGQREGEE